MAVVAIAGATGALGRATARALHERGHRVIGLTRRPGATQDLPGFDRERVADPRRREGLREALEDVDVLMSCLGASVMPGLGGGWSRYSKIDTPLNCNLIDAANEAGVDRCVYVSVASHEPLAHLDYVRAHERVVEHLRSRTRAHAVVRPTGFFTAFASMLPMARRGLLPVIGDPAVRTNPIHPVDLAHVCADAVEDPGFGEREVGGPEVLSRGEIAALALRAVGRSPRVMRVPAMLVRVMATLTLPLLPRVGHILRFYAAVGTRDCIAPPHGERTLAEYLRTEADAS